MNSQIVFLLREIGTRTGNAVAGFALNSQNKNFNESFGTLHVIANNKFPNKLIQQYIFG